MAGVMYDVVIVGGGPAGLSAALVLGRSRRRVLVCDSGTPRNAVSSALHGYLTRDGIAPLELLRLGREELRAYGVELREATVTGVTRQGDGFDVTLDPHGAVGAQSLLLATGIRDELPDVPGLDQCYGISVHHCPYCDGWEHRDKRLAVIGHGPAAAGLALSLKTWTDHVVVCSNGPSRLTNAQRDQLRMNDIALREEAITHVLHDHGRVRALGFAGGTVPCEAVFFSGRQAQQCDLPRRLGCEFTRKGTVKTDHLGETCVPGVYVVGDASRDVQFVIVAAAEGAKAGVAINKALQARAGHALTGA
jgi:thioredoxin reductase